ncbi:MAG TPA: nitroreductase family deazaflavin-dependent oxidoreductase [Terriglobales bacterium]|nr:nitroreductase family deazaflavin-dependent oxidoreductase [Terriglobales bacterium]
MPENQKAAAALDDEKYLYLTTRGRKTGRPREIEIWFTHYYGRFYIIAEFQQSQWVQNLRANPDVQIRVGETIWQARARLLSPEKEAELIRSVQELSRTKYGWGDGLVVELVPEGETSLPSSA